MGFFDLALSGVPKVLLIGLFFVTLGYRSMNKVLDFTPTEANEAEDDSKSESANKQKQEISTAIMGLCIIGFITQIWSVGTVAMLGGIFCILTGCISLKQSLARIDWGTVIVLGGSLGILFLLCCSH